MVNGYKIDIINDTPFDIDYIVEYSGISKQISSKHISILLEHESNLILTKHTMWSNNKLENIFSIFILLITSSFGNTCIDSEYLPLYINTKYNITESRTILLSECLYSSERDIKIWKIGYIMQICLVVLVSFLIILGCLRLPVVIASITIIGVLILICAILVKLITQKTTWEKNLVCIFVSCRKQNSIR